MNERRLSWVNLGRAQIEAVCTSGASFTVIAGVPSNARLIRIIVGDEGDSARFLFWSPSFAIVAQGQPIPDINVQASANP